MNAPADILNAIVDKLRDLPNVKKAVLFGSRARGDNTDRSDYDIAIYGDLTLYDKATLRYFCDNELATLHKIDLIFMQNDLPHALNENIKKDGVTIYENR